MTWDCGLVGEEWEQLSSHLQGPCLPTKCTASVGGQGRVPGTSLVGTDCPRRESCGRGVFQLQLTLSHCQVRHQPR